MNPLPQATATRTRTQAQAMMNRKLAVTDADLRSALSESAWGSQELAEALGVTIRTVQRARVGHVRRDIRRALYRLALSEPPARPDPWRCPSCARRSFSRVRWQDGTLTSWYSCTCGEWWLRHDDPPADVQVRTVGRRTPPV